MAKKKIGVKTSQKRKSKIHRKLGKAPGTITYVGSREVSKSKVDILEYNSDFFEAHIPGNIEQIVAHKDIPTCSWVNIIGLTDEVFIEKIGKQFGLNPLILEDTVNIHQRPKVDEYDGYIFGVFKMLYIDESNALVGEHIALVLLENCVLLFQEMEEDVFNGVRNRIENNLGHVRNMKSDYLFFALLDAIIDNYFEVLEYINHKIEILEEEVYENPTNDVAQRIQQLKKEVLKIRKWIYPVKELVGRLIDSENTLITKDTKLFLKDAEDHAVEINENLQIYREMSMSLMEMYMTNISNKMNEVMKVLTIMASIFIPLTFIAGIYGMNFDNMPELHTQNGYFVVLGIMVLLFIGMLIYFKNKRWL